MEKVTIRDDYIKLGQLLKLAGLVENGAEAKIVIQEGQVRVNGETCLMRGKKITENDLVDFNGTQIRVCR